MKAILFPYWFEAPNELKEFCESIGYNNPTYYNNYDLMFDSRVVEFCEKRLSDLWDEKFIKAKRIIGLDVDLLELVISVILILQKNGD